MKFYFVIILFFNMGNQCLATTPNQKYHHFLKQIKVSQLKDFWQTVKIYKLKKLFDGAATLEGSNTKTFILKFEGFKKLFPELDGYPEQQIYRLFEIFDFQNTGHVDWSNFFSTITILYFGSEKTLALTMFMMFDHTLDLRLDNVYLKLMLETNEQYLKINDQGEIQEASEIYHHLMSEEGLSVQLWLRQALKIIDFSKFRKIFNIFTEEKMEKQLVRSFYEWNQIYDSQKQKYIGYLINIKWFESWRLYISHQYNINIDIYSLNKSTIKTVKTCKKTFNRLQTVKLGIDTSRVLHGCRYIEIGPNKVLNMKNIDCVHNHLGEKPRQITNSQLQGEFQEILREGVSENMDYVIVSEKVWNYLKAIYDGFLQFRRTGFDSIELYPKIIKTYFSLFKGHIDFSAEVIRQVSAYLRIDQMLTNSCGVTEEDLEDKIIYYKTIGMQKWEQVQDHSYHFTELSPDVLIFLVCISKGQKEAFLKSHQKQPRDVLEVNLGDYVIYTDTHKQQKTAIFMGKSTEGKYILHFIGESYMNDVCLVQVEMQKYCKISSKLQQIQPQKRGYHNSLVGLPNGPGLGFINSTLQIFMNSKEMKRQIVMLDNNRSDKFIYCLSKIHNLLLKQAKIQAIDIKDVLDLYFNKFVDFQVSMSYNFLNELFSKFAAEIAEEGLPRFLSGYELQVEKKVDCIHCKSKTNYQEKVWALKVPIPEDKMRSYEVTWVPINNQTNQISKFKIIVKKQATLMQFMTILETEIGIKGKTYILSEIYSHDIVKNYHTAQRSATLANLKMRQTDQLYVYELQTDMGDFIHHHFNNKSLIQQEEIKKDMFVDCKHPDRGWIFGKVMQIEYLPYTHTSIVKVLHKFNKNESWEINYDVFDESIARFPNRSYESCEQYHLRLQQRIFNESSNSMKLVNIPLIINLPAWMRWKEFFYYVFLQIQKFISNQYHLSFENNGDVDKSHVNIKKDNLVKMDNFKQYKNSSKFPYKLHLVDYEGRCAICFKFLKLVVFKGQNDTYCEGCQLSQSQPISWQVKPADLLICVDWMGKDRYKSNLISESPSYMTKTIEFKKQDVTLTRCIQLMEKCSISSDQALCCNIFSQKQTSQRIINNPQILTIYLERLVQQQDGFKKVIKKPIKFSTKQLIVNSNKYHLVGVTSIEGQHLNIKHKSYILKGEQQWYEYDGKLVRLVPERYVEKVCAFVLYYHRSKDS